MGPPSIRGSRIQQKPNCRKTVRITYSQFKPRKTTGMTSSERTSRTRSRSPWTRIWSEGCDLPRSSCWTNSSSKRTTWSDSKVRRKSRLRTWQSSKIKICLNLRAYREFAKGPCKLRKSRYRMRTPLNANSSRPKKSCLAGEALARVS